MTSKQKPPAIVEAEKAKRVIRFSEIREVRAERKGEAVRRPDGRTLNESLPLPPEAEAERKAATLALKKREAKFRAMKTDDVSMAAAAAIHSLAQRAIGGDEGAMETLLRLAVSLVGGINSEVEREDFFKLAEKVAKKFEVWPMNYRPDFGEGAGRWLPARQRYKELGCGTESAIPHKAGTKIDPEDLWQRLVTDALIAIEWARRELAALPKSAKGKLRDRRFGRLHFREAYIALPGGAFLVCPAWVLKVPSLPPSPSAGPGAWKKFNPVVWELVQRFWLVDEDARKAAAFKLAGKDSRKLRTLTPFRNRMRQSVRGALESLAGNRKPKGREAQ